MPIASGEPSLHCQGVIAALPSVTKTELIVGALVAAFVLLDANSRRRARRRRGRVRWFGLGALATGAAAVALLGLPDRGRTVGQTVRGGTVTVAAQRKPAAPSSLSGSILNDAGFARLRAGDYKGALPLLEQAVKRLDGSGSIVDAYALYNLAATRFALGRCDGVLSMLDRSQKRQGRRPEIGRLRARAQKRCLER